MNTLKKILFSVAAAALFSVGSAQAERFDNDYAGDFWINLGAGVGINSSNNSSSDNNNILAIDISANYALDNHQLLTVRSAGNYFGDVTSYDVGAMYGLMQKNDMGYISFSAGLAALFAGDSSDKTDLGLPLEVQAFLTPTEHVGIGVILFGDTNLTNTSQSFGGVVLALQFGNLW